MDFLFTHLINLIFVGSDSMSFHRVIQCSTTEWIFLRDLELNKNTCASSSKDFVSKVAINWSHNVNFMLFYRSWIIEQIGLKLLDTIHSIRLRVILLVKLKCYLSEILNVCMELTRSVSDFVSKRELNAISTHWFWTNQTYISTQTRSWHLSF